MNTIKILMLSLFILSFMSCNDKNDTYSQSRKNIIIEKPKNGFLLQCKHSNGKIEVINGVSFDDFVNLKTIENNHITSDVNVLYAYEDLGDILLYDKRKDSFTLSVFNDEFKVFNIKDANEGKIEFDVTKQDGEILHSTLEYDDLTTKSFLENLYSFSDIPNPFYNDSNKKSVGACIGLAVAIAGVIVAVASVIVDINIDNCNAQRETDKYNCEHSSKKCIKANGRCHYICVPCPK